MVKAPSPALIKLAEQVGAQYKDWLIVVVDCEENIAWHTSSKTSAVGLAQFATDTIRRELQENLQARDNG